MRLNRYFNDFLKDTYECIKQYIQYVAQQIPILLTYYLINIIKFHEDLVIVDMVFQRMFIIKTYFGVLNCATNKHWHAYWSVVMCYVNLMLVSVIWA